MLESKDTEYDINNINRAYNENKLIFETDSSKKVKDTKINQKIDSKLNFDLNVSILFLNLGYFT
jgi:hypothetical protein